MEFFNIGGFVRYDPDRGKMKADKAKNTIVIDVNDGEDLAAYYRYLFQAELHFELLKPVHKIHMTVSKVHELNDQPRGFLSDEWADITISKELFWNNEFVWLNAYCESWSKIRKYYGLPEYKNGHITIGKFKPHDQPLITPHLNADCFKVAVDI